MKIPESFTYDQVLKPETVHLAKQDHSMTLGEKVAAFVIEMDQIERQQLVVAAEIHMLMRQQVKLAARFGEIATELKGMM